MPTPAVHPAAAAKRPAGIHIYLLFALFTVLAGFALLKAPLFRVEEVLVRGARHLSDEEVVLLSGLRPGANIWQIPVAEVEARFRQNPWVQSVRVERRLPNVIIIALEEREPAALLPHHGTFLVLDEQGMALDLEETLPDLEVPILTGLPQEGYEVGTVVPSEELAIALRVLRSLGARYRKAIVEIHIDPDRTVTLYSGAGAPVYLGQASPALEDRLGVLGAILDDIAARQLRVKYVDLRYEGKPVVRVIEEGVSP